MEDRTPRPFVRCGRPLTLDIFGHPRTYLPTTINPYSHFTPLATLPQLPHHCHTNAAGAVKTSPIKMKKDGYGSKGSWGSSKDEILSAREMLNSGELPPISSPERERSMRKVREKQARLTHRGMRPRNSGETE